MRKISFLHRGLSLGFAALHGVQQNIGCVATWESVLLAHHMIAKWNDTRVPPPSDGLPDALLLT